MYQFVGKINGQSVFKHRAGYFVDSACLEICETVGCIVYDDRLFSPLDNPEICRISDEINAKNRQLHHFIICEYNDGSADGTVDEPVITVMEKNEFDETASLYREYRGVEISQITDSFCKLEGK